MRGWAFVLWVWVAAATAFAAEGDAPAVAQARTLMASVKYKEAAKVLAAALAKGQTDVETTRQLFELSGIVAGTLNRQEQAHGFFLRLLSVAPEANLTKRFPPRVMTPFF